MALKPKKGKLTGTKKKDKITWSSSKEWKRAITVNAGNGNDVINFKKSKYKNKLNGQNGDDIIYGGNAADVIKGGKDKDKLYGNGGNDKLYGEAGKDVLYGGNGSDYIDGGADNDKIYGQSGNNTLKGGAGNDTIYGGKGVDKIYGGIGDDVLYSGSSKTTTFFFSAGDGTDNICNAKASDVIQIDSVANVSVLKNADNKLQINYGTDKIIIDNYNFEGTAANNIDTIKVKKSDGSYSQLSIYDKLNSGYDGTVLHISEDDIEQTFNLAEGNNVVVFDDVPNLGYGHYLQSANTAGNGFTDTIVLTNDEHNTGLSLMNNTLLIYGADEGEGYTNKLWLDATAFPGCPGDGDILYNDFYTSTAGNVVVTDDDRSYTAKGYDNSQTLTLPDDDIDRIIAIKGDSGSSSITSNGNHNIIAAFGGAYLEYIYGGGQDNVTSLEDYTGDDYYINLTANTSVNITDCGGNYDFMCINGTDLDDIRILFDVYELSGDWEYDDEHVIIMHKDNLSSGALAATTQFNLTPVDGINLRVNGEIERIYAKHTVDSSDYDIDVYISSWCDQIKASVATWLEAHNYDCLYDVFYGDTPCTDSTQLSSLVACYNTQFEYVIT